VLNSPAQHQIHHSDAPRHFNKNFGINLSVWDWMFGTLYVTQSKPEAIRFGTGEADHQRYLTLYSLIVTPFVETVGTLRQLKPLSGVSVVEVSSVPATARIAPRAVAPAAGTDAGPAS
jgi:hypothetical protein